MYNPGRDFFKGFERVRWPINLVEKFRRRNWRNVYYDFDSIFRLVFFFSFLKETIVYRVENFSRGRKKKEMKEEKCWHVARRTKAVK